jgi:hypothetical protein
MVGAQEELIEYGTSDYYDFEMRSRDVVAFLSRKGAIYVVHNFTIGQYHRIRKPPNIIAIAILLIIVISALLMVLAANQH